MVAPNSYHGRSEEIQLLIAGDMVDQAIARLMDFVRDFSNDKDNLNEVIVISASYRHLEKAERRQILTFRDAEDERRKLIFQILELMDSVKSSLVVAFAA
jgi:hypothetical protein